MLNHAPIFINGFSFGGTNLIMNLLASHAEVCLISGETHELFYSKPRKKLDKLMRRALYAPIQALSGGGVFSRLDLSSRHEVPDLLERYIDLIFYLDKALTDRNPEKTEGVPYTFAERRASRMLAKNVNGVVLACGIFAKMYPDATFFSLVRNGLALCDGYLRRGWDVNTVADIYSTVCGQMLRDAESIPNYHILRFEDMVREPVEFTRKIYTLAGLDISDDTLIRLQAKKSMTASGERTYTFGGAKDREVFWFRLPEIVHHIRSDVDSNQIKNISDSDRAVFLERTGDILEKLGYPAE